ncbi:hypothetical protein Tco_0291034 [Tanacetum coccineum]
MFKDLKKFQDELEKRHDVNYMSKVELECAKAKTELMSYKTESQKSINKYSYQINDLNQKIFDMKKELVALQETISIMSQHKEDQKKFYKTHEEKELEKVIALENKINVLDDIVYKTCCYNDNLALMLAPKSDETIRLAQESRSKLIISSTIETNFDPSIHKLMTNTERFFQSLQKEMVVDLKYFNSLENEIESLQSQLVTQRTQFLNEIDRLSREYYYADHMNVILGVYTTLDEFTDLQCDYVDQVVKRERPEKELSKRLENVNNKSFNELSK